MAYDTNYLAVTRSVAGGQAGYKEWVYDTADDAVAAVVAAGFISDAREKGLSVGDKVVIREWASAIPTTNLETNGRDGKPGQAAAAASGSLTAVQICHVAAIDAAGAADLSAGTSI